MLRKTRSVFDLDKLKTDLVAIETKLQSPEVWADQKLASDLGQQSKEIKQTLDMVNNWDQTIEDAEIALEIGDECILTITF